ncbi:MAG: hypothetical protein H7A47_12605 [Verrucomicrobiales bacterium]|nr:hypothetical protein [Verrucomicrobiales bacterium]
MKRTSLLPGIAVGALLASTGWIQTPTTRAAVPWGPDKPLEIVSSSKPAGGSMQILFHGSGGPFRIERRDAVSATAPWYDMLDARVVELEPGVYSAYLPIGPDDFAFYRVVNENEVIAELKGWTVRLSVSTPANGTHFVAGEQPVVTVDILDVYGQGIGQDELSTLSLYMHGPQSPLLTVTPLKLLNATGDRTQTPHHYIDLKTNPDVQVSGHQLTYTLQPVSDEAPGTYIVSLRAGLGVDAMQQIMKFASVQIGTATPETGVFTNDKCASCHEGTVSGKMYLHHVDPGRSPTGSWSLDFDPAQGCSACHNNDGYAALRDAAGERVPDQLVRRVHGLHLGEGLKLPFNRENAFADYVPVVFPADVRNCTTCHVDDRWKTNPSRLACGTCHDNVWFGIEDTPEGMEEHSGGPWSNDNLCKGCHNASKVEEYHLVEPPAFLYGVSVAMTPPANGEFYVAGETPKAMLQVIDLATGNPIDPASIVEPVDNANRQPHEWRDARFFVSGPRAMTVPVLTTVAANPSPDSTYLYNDLRVRQDSANEDPAATRTSDTIEYQLGDVADLAPGTYTAYFEVRPANGLGGHGYINFQVGTATAEREITAAASCISCHGATTMHSRAALFEPDICKNCHDYQHQMPDKTGWDDRNYGFGVSPLSWRVHGLHYGNYLDKPEVAGEDFAQVIFPQDVRNCTKCHSDSSTWDTKASRMACLACHDSDDAAFHGILMTFDPTPTDPWSGDEWETCTVCHGSGSDLSPSKVHAISNPYVPPYPRELRELVEE